MVDLHVSEAAADETRKIALLFGVTPDDLADDKRSLSACREIDIADKAVEPAR